MKRLIKNIATLPLLLVLVDQTWAQLSLPEMPGPPYPDRWGNNRWGVKYDPRIHGRGRSQQSSPSSSSGRWAGGRERDLPEELPPSRFRSNSGGPPAYPSRNKWIPGLKPLVSNFLKYRLRPRRPGPLSNHDATEMVYRNPYTRRAIDGYVQNYMNRYNSVVSQPGPYPSDTDYVRVPNFVRPSYASTTSTTGEFQPDDFDRVGNTPPTSHMSIVMMKRSDESVDDTQRSEINTGSLKDSYRSLTASSTTNTPTYRTLEPLSTDLQPPQFISKKSSSVPPSVSRTFAKKLRKFYNDYQPGGENAGSGVESSVSSSSSNSSDIRSDSASSDSTLSDDDSATSSSDDVSRFRRPISDDDEPLTAPTHRHPVKPRPRPRSHPSGKRGPHYVEREYKNVGAGRRPQGSQSYKRGHPRVSSGRYPHSSPNFHGDEQSSSKRRFPTRKPHYPPEYSDLHPSLYNSDTGSLNGFPPSSKPMTVTTTYTMSGSPPPEYLVDGYDSVLRPYSSPPLYSNPPGAPAPPLPAYTTTNSALNPYLASSPMAYVPGFAGSPYLSPELVLSPAYYNALEIERNNHTRKIIKRKKKRFQHTPINLIRGLLSRRDNQRKDNSGEQKVGDTDAYKQSNAGSVPAYALPPGPPPPPPQYSYSPHVNSLPSGPAGPPPPPLYPQYPYAYHHPTGPAGPPPPPPPLSPIAAGISNLRDSLTGAPHHPSAYYRPPPPPRPPRPPHNGDLKKDNAQDWPRIFTALGQSADAVAGGIHTVRKEISKMTGQTIAKGVRMGGSAVHEVSKGMAHVISKMSSI